MSSLIVMDYFTKRVALRDQTAVHILLSSKFDIPWVSLLFYIHTKDKILKATCSIK